MTDTKSQRPDGVKVEYEFVALKDFKAGDHQFFSNEAITGWLFDHLAKKVTEHYGTATALMKDMHGWNLKIPHPYTNLVKGRVLSLDDWA